MCWKSWVDAALKDLPALLVDHSNCEKKAASTALALIFAYPEDRALNVALSRLAREELKHFEQVERLMKRLDVPHKRMTPGRYASDLRKQVRSHEPKRKLDLMIVHALIEARSCERFRLLAKKLPAEVRDLYEQLERSEARHFEIYLEFAEREYAALGGLEGVDWPWGNEPPEQVERLQDIVALERPHAPGPDCENGFGLRCMADNVHEWCSDWYDAAYYGVSPGEAPRGPVSGKRRASRGGSWRHQVKFNHVSARSSLDPGFRYNDYGFRVYADA